MSDALAIVPESGVIAAFKAFERFCRVLLDAYVLVDASGQIVRCNALFCQLTGKTSRQILKGLAFNDLLQLSVSDKPLGITDLLEYKSPTRIDEVIASGHEGNPLVLIVGIYPFFAGEDNSTHLGTFILIRDVTAEKGLQDKYTKTAIKSITDPLTGLFTRAYFEDYLQMQARQEVAEQEAQNMTILMVDIDFFKKVNDVHGHQAGDYVIREVSGHMRKTFRKTDIPCRYGGEEFLVMLPSTDVRGACIAAQKLRVAIAESILDFEAKRIPITISIGVAQYMKGVETYTNTIGRADAALYQAKHSGRNRVCLHDGSAIQPAPELAEFVAVVPSLG